MKPVAPVKKTRIPFLLVLPIHFALSQCAKGGAFNCYAAKAFFISKAPSVGSSKAVAAVTDPALILLKFGVEFFADQVEGVGFKSKTKRWLVSFYDLDHCLSCASGIMVIAIIIMMMIIVTATGARRKAA